MGPGDVALCAPTLFDDLKATTEEEIAEVVAALGDARVSVTDYFATHLIVPAAVAESRPLTVPAAGNARVGGVRNTVNDIRQIVRAAPDVVGTAAAKRIVQSLADAEIEVAVIEWISVWPLGPGEDADADVNAVCDVAELMRSPMIGAICVEPGIDLATAAAGLARAADIARERGLRIAVEPLPFGGVVDLRVLMELVDAAGRENVGYILDTLHWHFQPEGPDFVSLRALPAEKVLFVQVSDGKRANVVPPAVEPFRQMPGEGEIDLPGFLRSLSDIGAEPIIASEVFGHDLLARYGRSGLACRVTDAMRDLLRRAASRVPSPPGSRAGVATDR